MPPPPRVFLSYSHDCDSHRERVLALSERLRQYGIPTILDRYVNGTPPEGWPHWMLDRLDESDRVLLICTPTYYRRFRGHEGPDQGKGVDWEGAILTQEIYDARNRTTRFIPVLFDPADESAIPEPIRGQTHYCLASEDAYQSLYDALLEQAGVEPGPVGPVKAKARPRGKPLTFDTAITATAPRIDLAHLPAGAEHFLGRGPELAALDAAWGQPDTAVVELIAPGGTGKTALAKRWLDGLWAQGWGDATQVYAWSFYSQGTGDDRQASEDHFLAAAIQWLGVKIEDSANPADKGRALAECIAARRTLLVPDGLEPLQYPPGPMAGELRAPGLKTLLTQLASAGQPGLCILTSREWLQDLNEWVRKDTNLPTHPHGAVLRLDLGNLSDADGAALLHAGGANKAGAAAIGPDDEELKQASREVQGHALTLSLLGRYLARTKGGDIRKRDAVDLVRADQDSRRHAAKVVAAYESWFAREGEDRSRELAALRLLGFFDRPASRELLEALRAAPPIAGLTEPLQGLDAEAWASTLANLADCGLAQPDGDSLDTHPLVREHLAETLQRTRPEAWREGHRQLYKWLEASVPHRPEGLDGLQPLYQAVAHGCLAGLWQEACDEVYDDRILRGSGSGGNYSTFKLGANGADLGAIACFFTEPWRRPAPALTEADQAWLLNEAATRMRALGRLVETLEPMAAGVELYVKQEDWKNAAIICSNLSELPLSLGRLAEAVAQARRAVNYADRSGDAVQRIISRSTLADALHQQGESREALAAFAEAERMQAEWQPECPLLYSLSGFQYCDLLLAGTEQAAWAGAGGLGKGDAEDDAGWVKACEEVAGRAGRTLGWAASVPNASLLTIALEYLTLARSTLYQDRLQGRPPGPEARGPRPESTASTPSTACAPLPARTTSPAASSPAPGCATP